MDRKNNLPSPDFNLFLASDAAMGTLEAIYELMAEVPADGSPERTRWHNAMTGLAWAGRRAAREMNDFLSTASDAHDFPQTWLDIKPDDDTNGVRETAAIYAIR